MAAASSARPDEVAGLALVGAHAERRIALHMLGDRIALACRQRDIGGGHVVVQIDKGAPPLAGGQRVRDRRRGGGRVRLVDLGNTAGIGGGIARHAKAAQGGGPRPGRFALGEAGGERKVPFAAPAQPPPRRSRPAPARRDRGSKRSRPRACAKSCTFGFQPPDTASRSQSSVTVRPRPASAAALGRTRTRRSAAAPGGPDHRMARNRAGCPSASRRAAAPGSGRGSTIAGDRDPGPRQRRGQRIGAVIVDEQHRAPSRRHRVTMQIGLDRAGQHDAGPVVVGKDQGPLDRPGRQHDAAGADVPQALARQSGGRRRPEPLADPFGRDQVVVVVTAEHRRLAQQPYFRHRVEFGDRAARPFRCRRPRRSAPDGAAARRRTRCRCRRGSPARRADPPPAPRSARPARRRPPARRNARGACRSATGPALPAPARARPYGAAAAPRAPATARRLAAHEGLVVEPGRQQRREPVGQRRDIEAEARPGMLACGAQPVIEENVGRAAGSARRRRRFRAAPAPTAPRSRRS